MEVQDGNRRLFRQRWFILTSVAVAIVGLILGYWIDRRYLSGNLTPEQQVSKAILDLQRQETIVSDIWNSIWNILPDTGRNWLSAWKPEPAKTTRLRAAGVLEELSPHSHRAIPALVKRLEDEDQDVQIRAIETLLSFGPAASVALPELLRFYQDTNINGTVLYRSPRGSAARALAEIAPTDTVVVSTLCNGLDEGDHTFGEPEIWPGTVQALERVATPSNQVIPKIVSKLDEIPAKSQIRLLNALSAIGPISPKVAEAMIKALHHTERQVVAAAMLGLAHMGTNSHAAAPVLTNLFIAWKQEEGQKIGAANVDLRMLTLHGTSEDVTYRYQLQMDGVGTSAQIIRTLGEIKSPVAIPLLERLYQEEREPLRIEAARARWLIDGRTDLVLPIIRGEFRQAPVWRRKLAILANCRGFGQDAIDFLMDATREEHREVRVMALRVLGTCGRKILERHSDIKAFLNDKDHQIRIAVLDILKAAGPDAAQFVPAIEPLLRKGKHVVRLAAAETLKVIDPSQAEKWKAELPKHIERFSTTNVVDEIE